MMQQLKRLLYKLFLGSAIAMANAGPSYAQVQAEDTIASTFIRYQQNHLQEKLFVHTDKDFYLAGETIWFKVYVADAFFHIPLPLSKIAYVEVIDRSQKPVLQTAIDIDDTTATGAGSISIPTSLGSGNYTLRAYTNWMKNYNETFFFNKTITIVNTIGSSQVRSILKQQDTVMVRFYPEGGNLVDGLPSKVAFKISNQSGEPVDGAGIIAGNKNDTIKFKTQHNGNGSFYFTPQKNIAYKVVLNMGQTPYKADLPVVYDQGYVMELKEENTGRLHINARCNIPVTGGIYLLAHTRQVLKIFQKEKLNAAGNAHFYINTTLLGDGITHFTLFNASKQPVCERLYFKQPGKKAMTSIKTGKETFGTREEVTVDISVTDEAGKPLQANMSAAVFLLDSLQKKPVENICTYLLLTSELGNKIENPSVYFDDTLQGTKEALDNIMLINGWRRFRWEDVFNDKKDCFQYLPETEGQVVNGKIINRINGQPAKDITSFVSIPGHDFIVSNAVSDKDGNVNFIFKQGHQKNEMVFQMARMADSNYIFDVKPCFMPVAVPVSLRSFIPELNSGNDLQQRSIYMQVENSFNIEKKHVLLPAASADTTVFYGHPDREYKLDDYTRFLTMEEVLKEYVAEVTIKKQGDNYFLRVKDKSLGTFFDNDPLILIDGIPVFDAGRMIKFDPLKVRSIDVVASRYFHNTQTYEGIVSFKTYEGDLAGYELDPNAVVVEYNAIQKKQEFYQPVYESAEQKKSRLPDFRNVLSWNPDISLPGDGTAKINFYTSGCTGQFLVFLQGLSKTGLPVSAVKTINVVP